MESRLALWVQDGEQAVSGWVGGMGMGREWEWAWVQWVVGSGLSLPICPAATGALPALCCNIPRASLPLPPNCGPLEEWDSVSVPVLPQ